MGVSLLSRGCLLVVWPWLLLSNRSRMVGTDLMAAFISTFSTCDLFRLIRCALGFIWSLLLATFGLLKPNPVVAHWSKQFLALTAYGSGVGWSLTNSIGVWSLLIMVGVFLLSKPSRSSGFRYIRFSVIVVFNQQEKSPWLYWKWILKSPVNSVSPGSPGRAKTAIPFDGARIQKSSGMRSLVLGCFFVENRIPVWSEIVMEGLIQLGHWWNRNPLSMHLRPGGVSQLKFVKILSKYFTYLIWLWLWRSVNGHNIVVDIGGSLFNNFGCYLGGWTSDWDVVVWVTAHYVFDISSLVVPIGLRLAVYISTSLRIIFSCFPVATTCHRPSVARAGFATVWFCEDVRMYVLVGCWLEFEREWGFCYEWPWFQASWVLFLVVALIGAASQHRIRGFRSEVRGTVGLGFSD